MEGNVFVYECRKHGRFFAAFTPGQWRMITGGKISCCVCHVPGMYLPGDSEEWIEEWDFEEELDSSRAMEDGDAYPS